MIFSLLSLIPAVLAPNLLNEPSFAAGSQLRQIKPDIHLVQLAAESERQAVCSSYRLLRSPIRKRDSLRGRYLC